MQPEEVVEEEPEPPKPAATRRPGLLGQARRRPGFPFRRRRPGAGLRGRPSPVEEEPEEVVEEPEEPEINIENMGEKFIKSLVNGQENENDAELTALLNDEDAGEFQDEFQNFLTK